MFNNKLSRKADREEDTQGWSSKTQMKKEAEALQKLGEKLVGLSDDVLNGIDMPAELYDAVIFAKSIKSRGARKRQMQFIGTVMRKIEHEQIQEAVENLEQGNYKKTVEFKETEKWRDELINGNRELLEQIIENHPGTNRQQLCQLVRNAVKEREKNKPPKAYRALFKYLRELKNK